MYENTPMTAAEQAGLLALLKARFEKNKKRHDGLTWEAVAERLQAHPDKLLSLQAMEKSGGEPDVAGLDPRTGACLFYDFSAESPKGRRSLCYDREALESRKDFPPAGNVLDAAAEMGISLMTEEEYRHLQTLGTFDQKSSNWLLTPPAIRALGGAIFADFRYATVFIYHNGASSYYAIRGFRGVLRV
ncbi:MAG: DUF4256 domain-containing protein [Marinilabiliales bacterium]|nr:DUF4256 domain-containing protein [Marinilabiliales bacterium]